MSDQQFTVTEDHLKLLRRMNVGWNRAECGAPTIDPKRPYSNSDMIGDMLNILGIELKTEVSAFGESYTTEVSSSSEDFPQKLYYRLTDLHNDSMKVLQIVLATGTFEAGDYTASEYGTDWVKVTE